MFGCRWLFYCYVIVVNIIFNLSYCMPYDRLMAFSVCLSICNAVHCDTQGQCRGWRLYRCVTNRALPIHFFGHFCCRMYHSATTHSDKPNCQNFASGVAMSSVVTWPNWPWLFQMWHFWQFVFAAKPYVVSSAIDLLSLPFLYVYLF